MGIHPTGKCNGIMVASGRIKKWGENSKPILFPGIAGRENGWVGDRVFVVDIQVRKEKEWILYVSAVVFQKKLECGT